MIDTNSISEKIYNVLKGFGLKVTRLDAEGNVTLSSGEARRFSVAEPNIAVRFSPSNKTIALMTGPGEVQEKIRTMLQQTAKESLYNFDYRRFAKKISPRGEQSDIAKQKESEVADVMEGFGSMYGSSKTSYQPLADNVKLVVRHRKGVNEESRGARSRNIKEIYVQRGDERFKMAEANLSAARAMARHLSEGGEVHDDIGTAISEMAGEQRKLREFVRYVNKKGLVNEASAEYVNLANESISEIRESFKRLASVKGYASACESVMSRGAAQELSEDDDFESVFTETHYDNRVAEAMASVRAAKSRRGVYEAAVSAAIQKENFADFKNALEEDAVMEFDSEQARLSHRVEGLSMCAENTQLKGFLNTVSRKIAEGSKLSVFETNSVKSCLAKINSQPVAESTKSNPLEKYEALLAECDIF